METKCDETGPRGKPTMVSDLLGDPLRRVRHFPSHVMLVAEYGEGREVVGVVRGCVKTVTRGDSDYVKLAYVLGLRVSPLHRNLGVGTKLVQALEEWFKRQGATYAYMATDCTNAPSINLFTKKCSYTKFRTPTMLVQPVHAHIKPVGSDISIIRLTPKSSESIYSRVFKNSDFFPLDIGSVLASRSSLGTFMAVPRKPRTKPDETDGDFPSSFAILSVWSTEEVFKLQMKGVSRLMHACCSGSRLLDSCMPWLRLPSFPNVFDKFWVYFMYGLHMEGEDGPHLMKGLCKFVHNLGRFDGGCGAVVTELSPSDPVAAVVPHWRRLSWAEDLWCLKKLSADGPETSDWIRSRSSSSPVIFVDPRDI
ncbi:PREDICTED: probable N-acetyltransferase HLS1 isoform X2 [Tarenaya hassleriana]|nr:PREDICTED: probable N-acetyltransferase HLS1 isoform X2 [Tarenaya hassleriana]